MWIFKILIIIAFGAVFIQDYKERLVYWFYYPLIGIFAFLLQAANCSIKLSLINTAINLIFVSFIFGATYVYFVLKSGHVSLSESFGVGDLLFFLFVCGSFPAITFLVIFVFALIFSLLLHIGLSRYNNSPTVPLAGNMSLFFGTVYLGSFVFESFLYIY